MVGGPEPVRLPAPGVNGWGLQPRYRTHDALSGRAHHDHGSGDGEDVEPDAEHDRAGDHDRPGGQPRHRSELWHDHTQDRAEGSAWRDSSAAIRDREEPGHINRQA